MKGAYETLLVRSRTGVPFAVLNERCDDLGKIHVKEDGGFGKGPRSLARNFCPKLQVPVEVLLASDSKSVRLGKVLRTFRNHPSLLLPTHPDFDCMIVA